MEFTYDAYKNLILLIKEHGYSFCDYLNYEKYDKSVIIRHDVDQDLKKALELSEVEHAMGISSIYFVLVTSNFYNIFSKKNREILQAICENGCSLGLHFDETQYCKIDENGWKEAVNYEISLLEQCIQRKVTSVSMHRISKETLEADRKIRDGKVINCYGKEFIRNHKYIADSRRYWKEDVEKLIREEQYKRFQILIHPFWYYWKGKSAKETLRSFCIDQAYRCYDELDKNIRNLNEFLEKSEVFV